MSGLLGIGTSNASFNLHSDLINKLKSEETARVNNPTLKGEASKE